MAVITNRVAKMYYLERADGHVIGFTNKCASTLVAKMSKGIKKAGIAEARKAREAGKDVVLIVRHPLDRLVSNYVFWRTVNVGAIRALFRNHPEHGPDLILPEDLQNMTIEEWYEWTQKKWNSHWADQVECHSDAEGFVPNVIYPWEVLQTLRTVPVNPSPRKGTWEDYFTPEFREEMEVRYAEDLALYERAKAEWDGERPKYY